MICIRKSVDRGYHMSIYTKSSAAKEEKPQEKRSNYEVVESYSAKIIPRPDISKIIKEEKGKKKKRTCLEGKYLYYKGEKIPILQFQKAGYEKILKFLLKIKM